MSVRNMVLVALFAALTAIGAFIKIPVPYVPFTLQPFFVLLSGSLLGSRLGALSQLVYVLVGLLGLPVFTQGGGPGYIMQPTFGYLVGFVICAYLVGKLTEKREKKNYFTYLGAMYIGMVVTYILGVTHLYLVTHFLVSSSFTLAKAIWIGAIVILPKDIILTAIIAYLAERIARALPNQF